MKQPTHYLEVKNDYKINGGQSKSFCFNECSIHSLSISIEESGYAGLFCDKQRVLEVQRCNQSCCCYSYDSRMTNVIIDHRLKTNNQGFQEENGAIKIKISVLSNFHFNIKHLFFVLKFDKRLLN